MNDRHIQWQYSKVSKQARQLMHAHKSCVLWLTGLSASGKSSIAYELERRLFAQRIQAYVLDGDNLRHGLNRDLGFTSEDRSENIRRTAEAAKLMVDVGVIVIVSLISPYQADRQLARVLFDEGEFIEVYVNCPLLICEERDPKGLYKKAREGTISNFTGISAPYEPPLKPDIVLRSHEQSLQESAEQIQHYLQSKRILDR